MSDDTDMMERAALFLSKGFVPLRADPDSKAIKFGGWQNHTPTEESISRDFARPSNLGLRCGDEHRDGTVLVGIDIDIEEPELVRCVERAIGRPVPCKRGKKGATYFVRINRETKTHKIMLARDGKKRAAIDILGTKAQTIVPPSVHPETKLPYQWIGAGPPLWDMDYRELPVFGMALIDEIKGFCKQDNDAIYALNDMEWHGVGGGGNTHDTCVRAVSCMVGRKWLDEDIQDRIQRAKREAAEAAGMAYDWPQAEKVIQEWINSSRDKNFDTTTKRKPSVDDIPIEVINSYVYVRGIDRMHHIRKGVSYGKFQFCNIHARDIPDAWDTVLRHPDCRQVDTYTYAPGQPQFCKEQNYEGDGEMDCLNTYSDSGITADPGDVEPFVQLVKDYCDNVPEAYNHVFAFLAYTVQNPGRRINHALVLQGEQGVGKDSMLLAMQRVYGAHNYSQVTLTNVESQFNEWLFGKQMIVFQEMLAPGRRNIYNKLKPYITDELHNINRKGLSLYRIPNRAVYIFLTNYKHALSLDPSDRRMWVWYSQMRPKSADYYKRYYTWLADDRSAGALMDWLQNFDTSRFNPSAPPPMTDAKRALIDNSTNDIEQFLKQALEERSWPLGCDLINIKHLYGSIRSVVKSSMTMVNEALENLCPNSTLDVRPRMGGQRMRFRAIRNLEQWEKATGPQMVKHYRMPVPPGMGETEGGYMLYEGSEVGQEGPAERSDTDGPDY